MILPILAYGHPILRKICTPITPDYPQLTNLLSNMWSTMYNAHGCGLAAPQVNLSIRLFVVASPDIKQVFINPTITHYSPETTIEEEGCLSIPLLSAAIKRSEHITIKYQDEAFISHTSTFSGDTARMIQHEYDHIEGRLYIDLLPPLEKKLIMKKLTAISKRKFKPPYPMR